MFIVLEGLDGAGKSTQIKKLEQLFTSQGHTCHYLHFPRFDAPVYGDLIARFLRGEFGGVDVVDPYLVALLYAGDRREAAPTIRGWIEAGDVVIVDRYVYSNLGYQCAKCHNEQERRRLSDWILNLEYTVHGIPRPDVSLFLDVPFAFTCEKLTSQRDGDDRDYLCGEKDIHESSLDLQRCVRSVYLDAASRDEDFKVVDCSDSQGGMDSPENIFAKIKKSIAPYIK